MVLGVGVCVLCKALRVLLYGSFKSNCIKSNADRAQASQDGQEWYTRAGMVPERAFCV